MCLPPWESEHTHTWKIRQATCWYYMNDYQVILISLGLNISVWPLTESRSNNLLACNVAWLPISCNLQHPLRPNLSLSTSYSIPPLIFIVLNVAKYTFYNLQ